MIFMLAGRVGSRARTSARTAFEIAIVLVWLCRRT